MQATIAAASTTCGSPLSNYVTLTNLNDPGALPQSILPLAGANQQAAVLSMFKTNLQVLVLDGFDHPLEGADVIFAAPSSGASGTYVDGSRIHSTRTDAAGQALAPTFTANGSVGLYSVTVSASLNGVSISRAVTFTNTRVGTTTSLVASPNPTAVYGQSVELDATVRPTSGSLVPAATLQFANGSTPLSSCSAITPLAGVARCTLNGLAPGNYSFTADYSVTPPAPPACRQVLRIPFAKPTRPFH